MSEDGKVISFRGGPVADGQFEPPPNVIALIEEIAEEVRQGKIAAVGIVTISPTHFIGTSFATAGTDAAHDLVAGSVYLLERVRKNVMDDD